MALHNPADLNLFAAVLTDDPAATIQDKALRNYAAAKLPSHDWERGGCRELDLTLLNLRKLEQELGQCIEWVSAPFTFDQLVLGEVKNATFGKQPASPMLANKRHRFCTQALKLYPIFWRCYLQGDSDLVFMNIGFRWDESARVARWNCKNDTLSVSLSCDVAGAFKGKHRHTEVEWRIPAFPLYQNRVDRETVIKYWESKGWEWPAVSNCDFCFFHRPHEQQLQAMAHPDRAVWWQAMETKVGATWGDVPLSEVLNPAQLSLDFDTDNLSCLCGD